MQDDLAEGSLVLRWRRTLPAPWPGQLFVLLGLTGFAISQPMLALLGGNPTLFTFHRVDGGILVLLALAVALLPPLVLWLATLVATTIDQRAGSILHVAFVAVLLWLAFLQVLQELGLSSPVPLLLLSALTSAAATVAYLRIAAVRTWAQLTAVLPAIAVGLFLTTSPSGDLLRRAADPVDAKGAANPVPVVILVFDEWSTQVLLDEDDQIDANRFANLARFAEDATWYRGYTTISPATEQAVPAMLTGQLPEADGAPIVPPLWTNHPDNLFRLLAPSHDLVVHESFTLLCGIRACDEHEVRQGGPRLGSLANTTWSLWQERVSPFSDDGVDRVLDDFEELPQRDGDPQPERPDGIPITAEDVEVHPERFVEFLDSLEARDNPTLFYLHLLLPHAPWHFYENGQPYNVPLQVAPLRPDSEWGTAMEKQRHLLQAEYSDRLLGETLDHLDAIGLYDDALIVVTADHGMAFVPGTWGRAITVETIGEVAYTPLLIKAPHQTEGHVDDSPIMTVDVLPTLAEILAVEIPWEIDGSPAGSDELAERGGERFVISVGDNPWQISSERLVIFGDDVKPSGRDRWLGPMAPLSRPLLGLHRWLGVEAYVRTPIGELIDTSGTPVVRIYDLETLLEPDAERAPLGVVAGTVLDDAEAELVLIAIDDLVVAAAPLGEAENLGDFRALLPSDALGAENELRVAVVGPDGVAEADVVP